MYVRFILYHASSHLLRILFHLDKHFKKVQQFNFHAYTFVYVPTICSIEAYFDKHLYSSPGAHVFMLF